MIVDDGVSPYSNQSNEFISAPTAFVMSSRKAAEMRRRRRRRRRREGEEELAGGSGEVEESSFSQLSQSVDPLTTGTSTLPTFPTPHTLPSPQHTNTAAIFGPPVNFGSAPPTSNVPPSTGRAARSTSKFQPTSSQPSYKVPPSPPAQQWRSCDRVSPSARKIDLPEGKRTPV